MKSLKNDSKDSRTRATEAFCNKALSINNRILAAKLRVISELLEGLERPETAIIGCRSFLKELHSLPAIKEIFSVYLNRRVKSLLNKPERMENVKSVMLINYALYEYVSKFSTKNFFVLTWPDIELAHRRFYPLTDWQEVVSRKSMVKDLSQQPNRLLLDEFICPYVFAVNSHGYVVVGNGDNVNIISSKGESKLVELLKHTGEERRIRGITVDKNNNLYVCAYLATATKSGVV